MDQPAENEYTRGLFRPATIDPPTLPPNHRHIFSELPPYGLTPITEWGACLYAKTGEIKAKSWSGLVTYYTRHPVLDWEWLQRVKPDWECCPQCGRWFPKEARYWWTRNRERGYLWLDACRDCKCKTDRRVREKKRFTKLTVQH